MRALITYKLMFLESSRVSCANLLVIISFCIIKFCPIALAQNPNEQIYRGPAQVVELTNQATVLCRSGNSKKAVALLRQAILIDPKCAAAHINLAAALNSLKCHEQSLHESEVAMQLDPKEEGGYLNYFSAALMANRLQDAIHVGQEYLKRFPNGLARSHITHQIAGVKDEIECRQRTESFIVAPPGSPDNYLALVSTGGKQRWTSSAMPLKVFIYPGLKCIGFTPEFENVLVESFQTWEKATKGLIGFIFVHDPHQADIECRWTDNAKELKSPSEGGDVVWQTNHNDFSHAAITLLTCDFTTKQNVSVPLMRATCLHEVGHALGLKGHSDKPGDILYPFINSNLVQAELSQRDVNTLTLLYQSEPR